jgi:hypothetical protein
VLRIGVLVLILTAAAGCAGSATTPAALTAHSTAFERAAAESPSLVVLEYEAWFGPHAVTFQDAEAMPILQSADMQSVGGGYDSADPHVIKRHVEWMEFMGVDAASIDLTNNVGCIFSTGPVSPKFCSPATEPFREQNRNIQSNTGNLYPSWSKLGTRLKLIPLLGCQTPRDVALGSDGKSGFEKEILYFGSLMQHYPSLNVWYLGHPLLLVYTGTPVDTNLLAQCKSVLRSSGLDEAYTFRFVGGYLDSQSTFWKNPAGPIEISPNYQFWSVVDRYKPAYELYPTYSVVPGSQGQAENLTVSIATAGHSGWDVRSQNTVPRTHYDTEKVGRSMSHSEDSCSSQANSSRAS